MALVYISHLMLFFLFLVARWHFYVFVLYSSLSFLDWRSCLCQACRACPCPKDSRHSEKDVLLDSRLRSKAWSCHHQLLPAHSTGDKEARSLLHALLFSPREKGECLYFLQWLLTPHGFCGKTPVYEFERSSSWMKCVTLWSAYFIYFK